MATTTPNFGWSVPTSTDLVKDGATAIELLGDSIDASLVDLKGGTTGQILSKASNADMDFVFITNDVGDITAVTAGTGISGGGSSGDVTITNAMATTIDAKGDLIPGTGADTFGRLVVGANETRLVADSGETTGLKYVADTTNYAIAAKGNLLAGTAADTVAALAVGTNGTVLTADSAEATGMKWATPASTSFPTFSAGASSSTTLATSTFTKINFDTEDWDTNSNFASSRFTPTVAGYYSLTTSLVTNLPNNSEMELLIYKNGTLWKRVLSSGGTNANSLALNGTALTYLNGSSDYAEVYMYYGSGAPGGLYAATTRVFFQGIGIRS
jgi:hypothetical protein